MNNILDMLHDFNTTSAIFRLLLAGLLAGVVGLERESHGRVAGLRTHILVGLGSAMAVMVGLYTYEVLNLGTDPLRVGAQVLSGIGFLGAGTILVRSTSKVTGLTTAAGLWCMASIGMACGVGFYSGAIVCTGISFVTVALLPKMEDRRKSKSKLWMYYLEVDDPSAINPIRESLNQGNFRIDEFEMTPARSALPGKVGIQLTLRMIGHVDEKNTLNELLNLAHVVLVLPNV